MQMTKRVLSLLLSLALLCTLTPMGFTAAAEEITEEIVEQSTEQVTEEVPADPENLLLPDDASAEDIVTDAIGTQIPVIGEAMPIEPWINPIYEGIIDAGDLPAVEPQQKPDAYVQATFVDAITAAEQLKEAMKNRTTTITLHVFHTSSDYYALLDALLAVAMIHDGDPKGGDYLAGHFFGLAEGSQVLPQRVSGGYNYTFELNMVYSTTASQEATLDSNVNYVLSKLNVSGKSDYEKIRAVYEYMCKYIRYDYGHLSDLDYLLQFSAYAALVNGTSVCQGYATLFYRFMMELGIDCRMVTGIGGDAENYGPHAWNIVEIDGLYYNLDSTWDEGITNYGWFLRNTWNFPYHYRDYVYDSLEFHTVYPMAAEDYVPGVPGEMDPFITYGYCGDNAIWLFSRYGELAITGTGAMYDYGNYWESNPDWTYFYGPYITAIYVDEGITRIGDYCFYGLDGVKEVVLAESVEEIGINAFNGCHSLSALMLPESLVSMGSGAFARCSALTEVTIPQGVTALPSGCFVDCGSLRSVTLPEGLTAIGSSAFEGCAALVNIELPDGLTSIDAWAFQYCSALESIVIPGTLETISDSVFSDCASLKTVVLEEGVKVIDQLAFKSCRALENVTLPDSLTSIGKSAFMGCDNLRNVSFPEGLTSIGEEAFYSCGSLTEIILPDSLVRLDKSAFSFCGALVKIRIPGKLESCGDNVFSGCTALTEVEFGEGISAVYRGMFQSCISLRKIVLPETVTSIEYQAFRNCKALESIVIPQSVTEIGDYAFYDCLALNTIYFEGDAPRFQFHSTANTFGQVTATAYYPSNNPTWTEEVMQNYGGIITWLPDCEHQFETVVTPPTCTEQGYTTKTCTLCGEVTVTDYVDAKGHSPSEVQIENNVPATCTAAGSYDKVTGCTVCNVELSRETVTVAILPHTPGEVQIENNVPATCTAAGGYDSVTYCTVCNVELSRETVTVDILPHTPGEVQLENVIPVTCSAPGSYDEAVYCETCSTELSRESFLVDPIAHTYTSQTVAPTCTTEGYTSYTCSVCGHSYTDQHHDALGHDYQDDHCTRCGRPEHYLGDVNGDDVVDAMDAYYILMYYREKIAFTELQLTLADVDGNGRVDTADVYWITLYVNGRITAFPKQ